MGQNPSAAGFTFNSFLFPNDVQPDPVAPINGSDIVKYFQRTPVLSRSKARVKSIILPSRIYAKGYTTHIFHPIKPYERSSMIIHFFSRRT